jgi:hypothetical protein
MSFIVTVFETAVVASTLTVHTQPSEALMTLFGWGAGSIPTMNPNTDNWSRNASFVAFGVD